MSDVENAIYIVYIEYNPKDILHTGNIWECERWVRKNGVVDTPYIIDRIREKSSKTVKSSKEKKSKRTSDSMHSQTIKEVSNIVEPLF